MDGFPRPRARSGRWERRGSRLLLFPDVPADASGTSEEAAAGEATTGEAGAADRGDEAAGGVRDGERRDGPRRILVFFGYSGAAGDGSTERDLSNLLVAHTLAEHLAQRFAEDAVEVVCAWHKDAFVRKILDAAPGTIRQIHYAGHGWSGGLSFGYRNARANADRTQLAASLTRPADTRTPAEKRRVALAGESALVSGFFTQALPAATRETLRKRMAPDALIQLWGCFGGAPDHVFDRTDPYWNLFNTAGAPVEGIALHLARSLGVHATAVYDPGGVHGMNYVYRDEQGKLHTNQRPKRMPQWLWPATAAVRWVTYDPAGSADEETIRFLDAPVPAGTLPSGTPPEWLMKEIPLARAKDAPPRLPDCSAAPAPVAS